MKKFWLGRIGVETFVKILEPQPFTFKGGPRSVLLLHGFTGNSADVRMLGRYLHKKGYTCHAPVYEGHGRTPEALMQSTLSQWWRDALNAYQYLQFLGYPEIAVVGLSMGGSFGVKLAYEKTVKGIVFMCTPIYFSHQKQLTAGLKHFARTHKQLERKDEDAIEKEIEKLIEQSTHTFQEIGNFIKEIDHMADDVNIPSLILQAKDDEIIDPENATYLYEKIKTENKQIKWYDDAGHAITLGNKRNQVHKDVYQFLETLDWET